MKSVSAILSVLSTCKKHHHDVCVSVIIYTVYVIIYRSPAVVLLNVPTARTVLGKIAFRCAAPLSWNSLQLKWKLSNLVPLNVFKARLDATQSEAVGTCSCG